VKFWLLPEIRAMIRDGRMRFLPGTVVRAIREDAVVLGVTTDEGAEPLEVEADVVLLMTGYEQDPALFRQVGVTLKGEARQPTFDPETMETDVPGLFVAGTASAGTQLGGVREFIETTHVHVDRILAALKGKRASGLIAPEYDQPES
jgi:thioredoxin reductase (NADPH)